MVPQVSVFCPPGLRLRNVLTASGERRLREEDIIVINGLRVTTALRTACDLGRLLHRSQAIGALDALTRLGVFTSEELIETTLRYRRYRGVVQLRWLVLIVDPRSESPGESTLRLVWWDAGLPRPECQVEVTTPWGSSYFIDIGLPDLRYGAEFDGEQFHGIDDEQHDEERRGWLRAEGGWLLDVARGHNVYGRNRDADLILRAGYTQAVELRR